MNSHQIDQRIDPRIDQRLQADGSGSPTGHIHHSPVSVNSMNSPNGSSGTPVIPGQAPLSSARLEGAGRPNGTSSDRFITADNSPTNGSALTSPNGGQPINVQHPPTTQTQTQTAQKHHQFKQSNDAPPRKRVRRVDPDKRKRTAIACFNCKKRKKKCNGEQPCLLCKERGLECIYIGDHHVSPNNPVSPVMTTSPNNEVIKHPPAPSGQPSRPVLATNGTPNLPPRSAKNSIAGDKNYRIDTRPDGKESSRMLRSNDGRLHFVGESCTLALLEQVRVLFSQILGTSSFTEDPERFNMVEGPQPKPANIPVQLPSKELANKLIDLFESNIHGLFYVLDAQKFYADVAAVYRNPIAAKASSLCVLHLVFSLGSLFHTLLDTETNDSSTNDPLEAKIPSTVFFNSALTFLDESVVDIGETWVVEAYLLSSFYYELTCRRNSSWIQLGKAIRYGQALGMGHQWASRSFPLDVQQHRHRLWQTLYVQDRIKSIFLGRPTMIDNRLPESIYDDVSDASSTGGSHSITQGTNYSPIYPYFVRLCEILGNIHHDIYEADSIYSRSAQKLIAKLKEWSTSFESVQTARVNDETSQKILVVVNVMYMHGIVLLTRPFLFYTVAKKAQLKNTHLDDALRTFEALAIACVQGSVATIRIVTSMFYEGWHPWRSPLVVYAVFTCGTIILLDAFQCRVTNSPLDEGISWAISSCLNILSHYSSYDLSAKRYHSILMQMNTSVFTGWQPQIKQQEPREIEQPTEPQQQQQQQQQLLEERLPSRQPSLPPNMSPATTAIAQTFLPMPPSLLSYGNTPLGGASPVPEPLQHQLQQPFQQHPLFSLNDMNIDEAFDQWSFTPLGPIMVPLNERTNGTEEVGLGNNRSGAYARYLLSEFEPADSILASGF